MQMIDYLKTSFESRSFVNAAKSEIENVSNSTLIPSQEQSSKLGFLLPLSCGHNQNFSNQEKYNLLSHLKAFGWIDADIELIFP